MSGNSDRAQLARGSRRRLLTIARYPHLVSVVSDELPPGALVHPPNHTLRGPGSASYNNERTNKLQ